MYFTVSALSMRNLYKLKEKRCNNKYKSKQNFDTNKTKFELEFSYTQFFIEEGLWKNKI
jgi:hypothetical protein